MSIEAITFVKSLPVDDKTSRLLLFIIGEHTFIDSGLCRVGQKVLSAETRMSERTIRRHLRKLEAAARLKIRPQFDPDGKRKCDAIELLGFIDWLPANRRTQSTNSTAGQNRGGRPPAGRQERSLLAGSHKETVQEPVQENARARADLKSGFGRGPALPAMRISPADPSWPTWIQHLRAGKYAELADDAETFGNLIVSKLWPVEDTPSPPLISGLVPPRRLQISNNPYMVVT